MASSIQVLALFAHPDDAEFLCAGTLIRLADRGASVHIATMTAGDCGSAILPPERIAQIRQNEARQSARHIQAEYTCFEEEDLLVFYDRDRLCKVMELVRRVDPALVFTHSPVDYMADHEITSRLCQTACFGAMAQNFRTGVAEPAKAIRAIPHLYYAAPFGGSDIFGNEIRSRVFVDITDVVERKQQMLACHESQQAWLRKQQGIPATPDVMHQSAERQGSHAGFRLAEGFRQHLGQGFPGDNLLARLLGELVRTVQ